MPKASICWTCKNARSGCSWMRQHKPVGGWQAAKTELGYLVKLCPQYTQSYAELSVAQIAQDMGASKRTVYRRGVKAIISFYAAQNRKVTYCSDNGRLYEWF